MSVALGWQMLPTLPLVAALASLPLPDQAPAPEADAPAKAAADSAASDVRGRRYVVAAKIVAGTSRAADSTTPLFGPGIDLEAELWPHGLEVEFAAAALLGDGFTSVPLELLLKKSFHVETKMDLFIAAGGILNVVDRRGVSQDQMSHGGDADQSNTEVHPGGIVLIGAYMWQGTHFGILIEMSYAMLSESGQLEHDVEGAVGVAYRF